MTKATFFFSFIFATWTLFSPARPPECIRSVFSSSPSTGIDAQIFHTSERILGRQVLAAKLLAAKAYAGWSRLQLNLTIRHSSHSRSSFPYAQRCRCSVLLAGLFARIHSATCSCPSSRANWKQSFQSQGQPFARANCRTAKCPFAAAEKQRSPSQRLPIARSHCNTSNCPWKAANQQDSSLQGQPFACAHCRTCKCPALAADRLVCASQSHSCARAHCSTSK
jgi:hypothetical protein